MAAKPTKTTSNTKSAKPRRASSTSAQIEETVRPAKRPVFQFNTILMVLLLAAVIGAAVYLNRQTSAEAEAESTPTVEEAFLFSATGTVTRIEVTPQEGKATRLERNAEKVWVLTQPQKAEADQGLAEAAAAQINALRIITEVPAVEDPAVFGLKTPAYVVEVGFESGATQSFEVGDPTPSENGYYVRLDGDKVYVVALSGVSALTNLVTAPPFLVVPTPTP